jgi:riboflavin biosynthesis pyrimidine reductase
LARGKPRFPTSAVLSRTGRLPLDRNFFTARDFESLVYLSSGASKRARHAIIATGRPLHEVPVGNEVPAMLRHMRHELGAGVLLVEGGPEMNAQLFRLDAVDEYFLTLGAVIVGGRRTLTAVGGDVPFTRETARRLELISAAPNDETAEVYLRYRVRR